jgi:hypothetical protein
MKRAEAVRIVDMSASNSWAEFAATRYVDVIIRLRKTGFVSQRDPGLLCHAHTRGGNSVTDRLGYEGAADWFDRWDGFEPTHTGQTPLPTLRHVRLFRGFPF